MDVDSFINENAPGVSTTPDALGNQVRKEPNAMQQLFYHVSTVPQSEQSQRTEGLS